MKKKVGIMSALVSSYDRRIAQRSIDTCGFTRDSLLGMPFWGHPLKINYI